MKYLGQVLLLIALLVLTSESFADREVHTNYLFEENNGDEAWIKLSNPSKDNLTYDVVCKSWDGSDSHQLMSNSIGAGQTTAHNVAEVSGSACKYNSYSTHSNGMMECSINGSDDYRMQTEAKANACNPGFHVCYPDEYVANRTGYPMYSAYLDRDLGETMSYTYDGGVMWYDFGANDIPYAFSYNDTNYRVNDGSNGGGVTIGDSMGSSMNNMTSYRRAMCCSNTIPPLPPTAKGDLCTIKVHGNDGFLISPNFKGGTPF